MFLVGEVDLDVIEKANRFYSNYNPSRLRKKETMMEGNAWLIFSFVYIHFIGYGYKLDSINNFLSYHNLINNSKPIWYM